MCVTQRDFVYTDTILSQTQYALVRKPKPQIGNCWVHFYRQRKKFSRIFHLYRISSLSGLARTLEIEYLVRHKITQSRTIPRTIDVFSRTICPPKSHTILIFLPHPVRRPVIATAKVCEHHGKSLKTPQQKFANTMAKVC